MGDVAAVGRRCRHRRTVHGRRRVSTRCAALRINGKRAVARLGGRSDADLAWETNLLRHLDGRGMVVPTPIPTPDGRWFVEGMVVMSYLEGESPQTAADWSRVAGHSARPARAHAGVAATTGLAILDRSAAGGDRNQGRPSRNAPGGCRSLPSCVGTPGRSTHVRRARRPELAQHPTDQRSRRADRLGRGARRHRNSRSRASSQRRRSAGRRVRRCHAGKSRMGRSRLLGSDGRRPVREEPPRTGSTGVAGR